MPEDLDAEQAVQNYLKAIDLGLLKIGATTRAHIYDRSDDCAAATTGCGGYLFRSWGRRWWRDVFGHGRQWGQCG